jgi:hypothetical protein
LRATLRFCFTNSAFLLRWAFLHIALGRLAASYADASTSSMFSVWLLWAAPMAMADVCWLAMHTELFPTVQPPLPPPPPPPRQHQHQEQQYQQQQQQQQRHQRPFVAAATELPPAFHLTPTSVAGTFEQWAMQQQVAYAVQTQEYYRALLDWQLGQTRQLLSRHHSQQPQ